MAWTRVILGTPGSVVATSPLGPNTHLSLTDLTNQLILGTTNTTTFNAAAPVASFVLTFPDAGGADSVVYRALAQTLTNKTLTAPTLGGAISGTPTLAAGATIGGSTLAIPQVTVVTATGTYTTPTGARALWVRILGGGGGGAGSAAAASAPGGASGAYSEKLIASPAATYSVTIGAGGAGGAGGGANSGTAGGTSAFGAVITGVGGGAGGGGGSASSAVGGTAGTGGDVNIAGNPSAAAGVGTVGENGGGSVLGGAGGGNNAVTGGAASANSGSGGGGGGNGQAGGAGAAGVAIVVAYF